MESEVAKKALARRIVAAVAVVMACITLLVALLGIWANRTVLDTDRFTAGVERTLDEPEVIDALATYLSRQVGDAVVNAGALEDRLPNLLDPLAPYLTATLRSAIETQTRRVVESDRGRAAIVRAASLAHRAALALLEGDPPSTGLVIVTKDEVLINLVPITALVLKRVQEFGVFSDLEVPTFTADQTPAEQITLLSEAIDRPLGERFGQLTVYERKPERAARIAFAQQMLRLFRASLWLLVAVTVLFALAAVAIAPNRRRVLIWLGVGVGLSGLLAHILVNNVRQAVPNLLTDPSARAAVSVMIDDIVGRLDRTFVFLALVAGALVLLLSVFAGRHWTATVERVSAFARRSPDVVRVVGISLAVLVLLWMGIGLLSLLVAAALVAAGLLLPTRAPAQGQA